MKKEELIRKSLDSNLKSKEEILENILNVIREEEKIKDKKDDFNILVLLLIQRKDMHGYDIVKEMQIKSKGTFLMNEGEVYPILHSLENSKLIESYWKYEDDIELKYYRLTKSGREYLEINTNEIKKLSFLGTYVKLEKID